MNIDIQSEIETLTKQFEQAMEVASELWAKYQEAQASIDPQRKEWYEAWQKMERAKNRLEAMKIIAKEFPVATPTT